VYKLLEVFTIKSRDVFLYHPELRQNSSTHFSPTTIDTSPTIVDASPTTVDASPTTIDASPTTVDASPTTVDTFQHPSSYVNPEKLPTRPPVYYKYEV
jgi:hypothetical protein